MNIKKILLLIPMIAFTQHAHAGLFTMGDGKMWLSMCSGKDEKYPGQIGKDFCYYALTSYQVGVWAQAQDLKQTPTLCGRPDSEDIVNDFITYLKSDKDNMKKDFIYLVYRYNNTKRHPL